MLIIGNGHIVRISVARKPNRSPFQHFDASSRQKCVQFTQRLALSSTLAIRRWSNSDTAGEHATVNETERQPLRNNRIVDEYRRYTRRYALEIHPLVSRSSSSRGISVRATTKKPSGELEKFLCCAKYILTETRESLGRRTWTTLVLYIISLCALCTAGSFDKARARWLLLVRGGARVHGCPGVAGGWLQYDGR